MPTPQKSQQIKKIYCAHNQQFYTGLFYCLLFVTALINFARAQDGQDVAPLQLDGNSSYSNLANYAAYFIDEPSEKFAGSPEKPMVLPQNDASFQPLQRETINFGTVKGNVWLRLSLISNHDSTQSFVLDTHLRYLDNFSVYLEHGGQVSHLVSETLRSSFTHRPLQNPHSAALFSLPANDRATLYIGYSSYKTTVLPASIESAQQYYRRIQRTEILDTFLYGAAIAIVSYSLLQLIFVRRLVILSYAAYTLTTLLYFSHMDGYSFKLLWPDNPTWNVFASLPLGVMSIIFFAQFGRAFLQTAKHHIYIDRALIAVIVGAFSTIPLGLFFTETMKSWSYWFHVPAGILCLTAAVLSVREGMRSALYYLIGVIALFVTIFTVGMVSSSTGAMTDGLYVQYMLPALLFDATLFGVALTSQMRDAQQARDLALNQELAAADQHKRIMDKLYRTEKEKNEVLELAREQGRMLAAAGHDLKQPLLSLKLTIAKLAQIEGPSQNIFVTFSESFAQIEQLATGYLSNPSSTERIAPTENKPGAFSGEHAINQIISDVATIFKTKAQALGVNLKYMPCSLSVREEPLPVRALLNSVLEYVISRKNTVRRITLGCRRINTSAGNASVKVLIFEDGEEDPSTDEYFATTLARPEHNYAFSIKRSATMTCYSITLPIHRHDKACY